MNRLFIYGESVYDIKSYTFRKYRKLFSSLEIDKENSIFAKKFRSDNDLLDPELKKITSDFESGAVKPEHIYISDSNFPIQVDNYNDFLDTMNIKVGEANLSWNYYIFKFDDNVFGVFRSDILNSNPEPYLIYNVENNCMFELWKKILKLQKRDSRFFIVGESSYNTFLCRKELLKVICKKEQLVNDGVELYSCFKKRKKNGKYRTIYAPNEELKEALRGANFFLQHVYDNSNIDFQVAYKKGKSVLSNAERHRQYQHTVNIDLSDFFPSCRRELVSKVLNSVFKGFNSEFLKNSFLDAILINDGLFIGCPVSGCLANAVISTPVRYLYYMCKKIGLEFSVYADDMSFSSDKFIPVKMVEALFNKAFEKYGLGDYFKINPDKIHGSSGHYRRITGVSFSNNNETVTNRRFYRSVRTGLYKLRNGDADVMPLKKLQGKIAYGLMIDKSGKYQRLLEEYADVAVEYKLGGYGKDDEKVNG